MIAVYIAVGLLLIFSNILMDYVPEKRTVLGSVFIIYACFRTMMTVQKIRKLNNKAEQNT